MTRWKSGICKMHWGKMGWGWRKVLKLDRGSGFSWNMVDYINPGPSSHCPPKFFVDKVLELSVTLLGLGLGGMGPGLNNMYYITTATVFVLLSSRRFSQYNKTGLEETKTWIKSFAPYSNDRCSICHFFRNGIRQGRIYLEGGEVTECSDMFKEVCPTHLWNALVLETKRGKLWQSSRYQWSSSRSRVCLLFT